MINLNSLTKNIKDGFKAPTGDSNRETPTKGALRFNTETGKPEIYAKGRGWRRASVSEISAIYTHDNLVAFYDASNADTTGDTSDQYYSDVSLLLHMNGTDMSTTFTDSSNASRTVTRGGDPRISTDEFKFGGSSGEFNGSNTYLTVPASSDFVMTGDYTIEGWFYPTNKTSGSTIISIWPSGGAVGACGLWLYNNKLRWDTRPSNNVTYSLDSTSIISTGQWYNFAIVRSGTTQSMYINGTLESSNTMSDTVGLSNLTPSVGRFVSDYYDGWIDELRITNNVARYTSNFTPQTREFYPGTGVDDITSNDYSGFLVGDAYLNTTQPKSYVFDGYPNTGDLIRLNTYNFGGISSTFTIIAWVKVSTFTNYTAIIAQGGTTTSPFGGFSLVTSTDSSNSFYTGARIGSSWYSMNFGSGLSTNTWYQVAYTFSNGTMKGYINADLENTSTPAVGGLQYTTNNPVTIGYNNYSNYYDGDIAIVKVYDSALSNADITNEFNYHKSTFGL